MDNIQLDSFEVQTFLDSLAPMEMFIVRFIKQNGQVTEYMGHLYGERLRKESVVIYTLDGFKRFNVNRVIEIEKV